MFSDGYTDQFGGEEGRTFSTRRVRQLLAQQQGASLANVFETLEQELDTWQGDRKQVDDILFMGIEL